MNNKIIVICGFSGAGKDLIVKQISDNYPYKRIISTTSRPMRPNEAEGDAYNFVTRDEFEDMIREGRFIEFRIYDTLVNNIPDTWYYGVHKKDVDIENSSYIVVLDVLGLKEFKEVYGDKIISFFIDVDEDLRKSRASKSRVDFDITEWERRCADDVSMFPPSVIAEEVDYIVENYDFDKCIKQILSLIEGEGNN